MSPIALTKKLERQTRLLQLAGDAARIRILQLLSKRDRANVTEIAREISMNLPCVSHHLQLLKDNKVVTTTRDGNNIYYSLAADKFVHSLIKTINS
jgi:DNA-binding transcriptional ArsR family regulator